MLPPSSWAPDESSSVNSFYSNNFMDANTSKDPKAVAAQFESIFYRILLSQARDASFGDDILGSSEMDHVTEMRDNEMSQNLGSMGYLGFAELMSDQDSPQKPGLLKNPNGAT